MNVYVLFLYFFFPSSFYKYVLSSLTFVLIKIKNKKKKWERGKKVLRSLCCAKLHSLKYDKKKKRLLKLWRKSDAIIFFWVSHLRCALCNIKGEREREYTYKKRGILWMVSQETLVSFCMPRIYIKAKAPYYLFI